MPIQLLPPQLANQIAAGEVVERPSSVVKELVENSLDAGATQIRVEIENGGASLIRIRDNGLGISKEELPLALARHATSKITCMDDLEAILSFGFRGEALASISSVSRLTLTSRTAEQKEAWQVYVQGRDQDCSIQPASHPVGTTVDVANLFFNTPARRKFLRTEKTEFAHIDEVIRRIALAKPQVEFVLIHNGKVVRQYKSAVNNSYKLKRLAAICGDDFVQHALEIQWKHDDLHLSGWVGAPSFVRGQNELAYCYVNGRMVKDKVINHAIRQAYAEHLHSEQSPVFVLFLDLNPNDVDVNVHPTKHEVRFQQSRLVHDFIYQGVSNALASAQQLDFNAPITENESNIQEPTPSYTQSYAPSIKPNRAAAGQNIFIPQHNPATSSSAYYERPNYPKQPDFTSHIQREKVSKSEQRLYGELLQTPTEPPVKTEQVTTQVRADEVQNSHILRALSLVQDKALLLQQNAEFYLLPLAKLQKLHTQLNLNPQAATQQLLIPVVFRLTDELRSTWQQQQGFFAESGFEFITHSSQPRITLNRVPLCLRQQNLQHLVISLLTQSIDNIEDFKSQIYQLLELEQINVFASAVNLLQEVELLLNQQSEISLQSLFIPVDFSLYLNH